MRPLVEGAATRYRVLVFALTVAPIVVAEY